jgi:hypothetical protein
MLQETLMTFMKAQVVVLNERIRNRLLAYQGAHKGFTDMKVHDPIVEASPGMIHAFLSYSGLATWIAEYGSGSKMDTSNPYLGQYKMNPARKSQGNAFVGRKKGETVYRPDGTSYKSLGQAVGKNLETFYHTHYVPQPAQHLIQLEVNAWVQEIVPQMKELVQRDIVARIRDGVEL